MTSYNEMLKQAVLKKQQQEKSQKLKEVADKLLKSQANPTPIDQPSITQSSRPFITLKEFKSNPEKYHLPTFREFKKNRQQTNPMPKGRPPKGYISHKKAYDQFLFDVYQKILNQL